MVEGTTSPPERAGGRSVSREENTVWALVHISLLLAVVGLVDGLVMAFKRTVARCPDGKYFSPGTTNFNCYVHPHAGVGLAIAVFSVLLGISVAVSGISAVTSIRAEGAQRST
jgi:hypothetical protein